MDLQCYSFPSVLLPFLWLKGLRLTSGRVNPLSSSPSLGSKSCIPLPVVLLENYIKVSLKDIAMETLSVRRQVCNVP